MGLHQESMLLSKLSEEQKNLPKIKTKQKQLTFFQLVHNQEFLCPSKNASLMPMSPCQNVFLTYL